MALSGELTINVRGDFDELSACVEGLADDMTPLFDLQAALKVAADTHRRSVGRRDSDEPSSIEVYGVTATPNDE